MTVIKFDLDSLNEEERLSSLDVEVNELSFVVKNVFVEDRWVDIISKVIEGEHKNKCVRQRFFTDMKDGERTSSSKRLYYLTRACQLSNGDQGISDIRGLIGKNFVANSKFYSGTQTDKITGEKRSHQYIGLVNYQMYISEDALDKIADRIKESEVPF